MDLSKLKYNLRGRQIVVKEEELEEKEEKERKTEKKRKRTKTKDRVAEGKKRREEWENAWKPIEDGGREWTRQQIEKARCAQGLVRQGTTDPNPDDCTLLYFRCRRNQRMLKNHQDPDVAPCRYRWRAIRQMASLKKPKVSDTWKLYELNRHNHPLTNRTSYVPKDDEQREEGRDYYTDWFGRLWAFVAEIRSDEELNALKAKNGVYKDRRAKNVMRCQATKFGCLYKMYIVQQQKEGEGAARSIYERGQHNHSLGVYNEFERQSSDNDEKEHDFQYNEDVKEGWCQEEQNGLLADVYQPIYYLHGQVASSGYDDQQQEINVVDEEDGDEVVPGYGPYRSDYFGAVAAEEVVDGSSDKHSGDNYEAFNHNRVSTNHK